MPGSIVKEEASFANKYRHPHLSVIKEFIRKGVLFNLVDESTGSRVVYYIRGI